MRPYMIPPTPARILPVFLQSPAKEAIRAPICTSHYQSPIRAHRPLGLDSTNAKQTELKPALRKSRSTLRDPTRTCPHLPAPITGSPWDSTKPPGKPRPNSNRKVEARADLKLAHTYIMQTPRKRGRRRSAHRRAASVHRTQNAEHKTQDAKHKNTEHRTQDAELHLPSGARTLKLRGARPALRVLRVARVSDLRASRSLRCSGGAQRRRPVRLRARRLLVRPRANSGSEPADLAQPYPISANI
ncbi:hypothetical protein B0H15DRAFT_433623 [Mycena belliarum]|uniref:Uncharacterized protein n=1 Tax=Mycena belliarum TaxID=1033014 RepID=A0AAD6XN73_9AGAR|nr:hypothetical protein B0H15DRAFT_433623 [Mycena belliae]